MEVENKIWLDDVSLGYVDEDVEDVEDVSENIHYLTRKELNDIKEFLMVDELDEDIFEDIFVQLSGSVRDIYVEYVMTEKDLYNNQDVATYEEFLKALELKLDDRFYTEINRYVKFSNGRVYYINDNTLLG